MTSQWFFMLKKRETLFYIILVCSNFENSEEKLTFSTLFETLALSRVIRREGWGGGSLFSTPGL